MKLLALRLCEHDSNISYFDGERLHYLKSERKDQIKHHGYNNLWEWKDVIKDVWGIDHQEIDEIAIVIDPWVHGFPASKNVMPAEEYPLFPAQCKVWKVHHHYAHALSSWPINPDRVDISFVFDGFGDENEAWTIIRDQKIVAQGLFNEHGSIGYKMSEMGIALGIPESDGVDIAGKLMGLQSYGNLDLSFLKILEQFSAYQINQLFDINLWYKHKGSVTLGNLTLLDWSHTVHFQVGELLLSFFKQYANKYDIISYSGGVAQNVIWNTKLKDYFENLIIPPHCNDEGLSLGAIEWLRQKNNLPRFTLQNFPFSQSDCVPDTTPTEETINFVAKKLAKGDVVAWYQGQGEVGPRALGNRSILMNPLVQNGKEKINQIKKRENYRPFGASVLNRFKEEYFGLTYENPHMLFVGNSKYDLDCITHVDGTCRVQTVGDENVLFKNLLERFYKITGCPVLLNTSLNIAGKPIVAYPENALEFFERSMVDVLVIGNEVYIK
jgi:carbamoyltransferase